jgi:hypothetical protein
MEPTLWPGGPPIAHVAMMEEAQRAREERAREREAEQRRTDEIAAVVLRASASQGSQ